MHLEYHPFYPCTEDEKQMIRKELGMKDSILQEDIDAIMDWFYKQPHLADAHIDRDYIENMLIVSKGSLEKAKRRIDDLYKYRSYAPELIQGRIKDLSNPAFNPWTFYRQTAMLKLYNGKRISVLQVTDPNTSNFVFETLFRNTILLGDLRLKFDYMIGDIWVLDLQNISLGHMLRINLTQTKKFFNIIQDGIGFKIYEIHVLNASSISQHLVTFFKQFVKPKIMERIRFHPTVEGLQESIPKQYLPKDFGGDQPYLEEFKEMYIRELKKPLSKDYLLRCCGQVSDELKRVHDKTHEEHLVGSFKKLEFD